MRRRARALVLAGATAAVGVILAGLVAGHPPAAAAQPSGTYTITTCSPGSSSGAWQAVNQAPASLTAGNLCGNGTPAIGPNPVFGITDTGALYGEDQIGSTTQVPNLEQAGWQLTMPAGVTITGISYYGSFETDGGGWLAGLQIDGQPLPNVCETNVQTADCDCRTNLDDTSPCQVLNNQVPQVLSNLDASSLFFGVACDQVQGLVSCTPNVETSHAVEADLYSAKVTLVESGGPQISSEGGALWSAGPVWGTVPITFTASDPSGIASVDVLSPSGSAVADVPESCDFSQVQACPELPSGQVQVNTLGLPDGADRVSLKLTNAAGDITAVQGPTVVVDNNGPPAPASLTAASGTSSNVIDLSWSDPANPPEPVQDAYAQLCQIACAAPVQISASGGAQITAPAAGTYTVRVWLTDSAGRGSAAQAATASVTVPAQTTTPSSTTSITTTSSTTSSPPPSCKPASKCPVIKVKSATWANGRLSLTIAKLSNGDRLQITLYYAHKPKRILTTKKSRVTIKTVLPTRLVLRALKAKRPQGALVTVTKVSTAAKLDLGRR